MLMVAPIPLLHGQNPQYLLLPYGLSSSSGSGSGAFATSTISMCGESSALFNSLSSDTLSMSLCDGGIKKGEEEREMMMKAKKRRVKEKKNN